MLDSKGIISNFPAPYGPFNFDNAFILSHMLSNLIVSAFLIHFLIIKEDRHDLTGISDFICLVANHCQKFLVLTELHDSKVDYLIIQSFNYIHLKIVTSKYCSGHVLVAIVNTNPL